MCVCFCIECMCVLYVCAYVSHFTHASDVTCASVCICERIVGFNESLWNYDKGNNINIAVKRLIRSCVVAAWCLITSFSFDIFGISSFCFFFFRSLYYAVVDVVVFFSLYIFFLPSITFSFVSIFNIISLSKRVAEQIERSSDFRLLLLPLLLLLRFY